MDADLGSDVFRPEKELIIIPPEDKLEHFEKQAQMHEGNQQAGVVECTTGLVVNSSRRFSKQYFKYY